MTEKISDSLHSLIKGFSTYWIGDVLHRKILKKNLLIFLNLVFTSFAKEFFSKKKKEV